jgi:uncharacterized phage-associated protein
MENLTTFEVISFAVSITSLTLGIVAIYISFHQKKEADKINEKTVNLLVEIRTDAKTVSQVAMPELQKYGDMSRKMISDISNASSNWDIKDTKVSSDSDNK